MGDRIAWLKGLFGERRARSSTSSQASPFRDGTYRRLRSEDIRHRWQALTFAD